MKISLNIGDLVKNEDDIIGMYIGKCEESYRSWDHKFIVDWYDKEEARTYLTLEELLEYRQVFLEQHGHK